MSGFLTPLRVERIDEDHWILLEPLRYRSDLYGGIIEVPKGQVTDFASVPRAPMAYLLAGNTAHRAACVHDYGYQRRCIARRDIDAIFQEAMLADGVPGWRAGLMWSAVRAFGWAVWRRAPERRQELRLVAQSYVSKTSDFA